MDELTEPIDSSMGIPPAVAEGKPEAGEITQAIEKPRPKSHKPKGTNSGSTGLKSTINTKPGEIPDGLPKKYFFKSTWNQHDLMHSPVEKTIDMIGKILSGERLFTM